MDKEDIVARLAKRAEIRRKATCRGPEDRLANDLDEAAAAITTLRALVLWFEQQQTEGGK
jgi:hypothetical protein